MNAALQPLFAKLDGLTGVFVASSDGSALLRAVPEGAGASAIDPRAVAAFAFACEQAKSIDFGVLRTATAFYERSVLLHMSAGFEQSLVVTLAAKVETDITRMHALVPVLTELFAGLSADGVVET